MPPSISILILIAAFVGWGLAENEIPITPRGRKRRTLCESIGRDPDKTRSLIENGLNPNFSRHGLSPLARAFGRNDVSLITFLLEHGASLSPKSPGNAPLLREATRKGNRALMDMVLTAGHDVHGEGGFGTPLEMAVRNNSPDTIRYLFSKGAVADDLRNCRWHTINGTTILTLLDLGVPVPDDVATAVRQGQWDTPVVKAP